MALTAQQLSDLRNDIGDNATAFSDDELNRNWDRVSTATSDSQRHEATLYLCWQQIAAQAAKGYDQRTGLTEDKLSQVFDHAQKMMGLYKTSFDAATSQRKQVSIGVVLSTVHPTRRYPSEDERS